jgi:hypothetical protein
MLDFRLPIVRLNVAHDRTATYDVVVDYNDASHPDHTRTFLPPSGSGTEDDGFYMVTPQGSSRNCKIRIESGSPLPVSIPLVEWIVRTTPQTR